MTIQEIHDKFLICDGICTDTRNIVKNALFFALKGEAFDGNKYAQYALENGCRYAIIDNADYKTDENYILVQNVLETLQNLASYHRKYLHLPIIAITGTNGKTTTKELVNAVLSKKYNALATKGNLNNHIGVPLTLLSMTSKTEIGIVEMGANHNGEIKTLCEIANPDYGLITNIGKAHIEGFGSFEGVIKTKKELYDNISANNKTTFIRYDNDILKEIAPQKNIVKYGNNPDYDVSCTKFSAEPFLEVEWKTANIPTQLSKTNLIGIYNYENVLAAITIGLHFNVSINDINQALESYTPSNNRSQIKKTKNNTLILDAYNANPTSMKASLDNLFQISHGNKTVIIGDMLELGNVSEQEHQQIIKQLEKYDFNKVILVGPIFQKVNTVEKFINFSSTSVLIEWIQKNPIKNALILIKASRGIKLEGIAEYL
ncbi:MAG TPA: UDP-N-acetylmuramoyl-tripeptide--D-alanyl-D-alanine ligase [Bacteroidales bacterium]|nr:MAG: hypothetical protein A2W98_02080 [Bacteroidetes bacterium GWF2_33_38]OFY74245.1 MAG: hypothetical protein A2265_01685 [Bacteroidetes bacterium RIFOXYA12_FULL_33_9]OFY91770.1 MAG: hypothetical protein A2236_08270 [Bacteroidetes bacterium RIFOXYA2_FULL_33_7]HBF88456.1 UDP-N-acetylmuramoyl-tripeptide--D-alanyl-D-alanine ligase [Bacteroidales bacterium]